MSSRTLYLSAISLVICTVLVLLYFHTQKVGELQAAAVAARQEGVQEGALRQWAEGAANDLRLVGGAPRSVPSDERGRWEDEVSRLNERVRKAASGDELEKVVREVEKKLEDVDRGNQREHPLWNVYQLRQAELIELRKKRQRSK
jgi:hypothetical protein